MPASSRSRSHTRTPIHVLFCVASNHSCVHAWRQSGDGRWGHARKSERALLDCESDICCVSRVESYSLLPLLFVQRAAKIPHACSRLVLWIPHRNVVGSAGGPRRFSGVSARPQGVWRLSDSASVALDPAHLFAFALT